MRGFPFGGCCEGLWTALGWCQWRTVSVLGGNLEGKVGLGYER